jgi:hypothetical protein
LWLRRPEGVARDISGSIVGHEKEYFGGRRYFYDFYEFFAC